MSLARADHPGTDITVRLAGAARDPRSSDEAVDAGRLRREARSVDDRRPWMPSARGVVIALLLGGEAGAIAALWLTLVEGVGIVLSLGS